MTLLEEGDNFCHSTQIIIMYLLGQRERTMSMGKHGLIVWEWRALLPVLISACGWEVNVKQHVNRQRSEIAPDPAFLCIGKHLPSRCSPSLATL